MTCEKLQEEIKSLKEQLEQASRVVANLKTELDRITKLVRLTDETLLVAEQCISPEVVKVKIIDARELIQFALRKERKTRLCEST